MAEGMGSRAVTRRAGQRRLHLTPPEGALSRREKQELDTQALLPDTETLQCFGAGVYHLPRRLNESDRL